MEYEQQLVLDKKLPAKRDFESWLHNKIARHAALRTQASTYHIPVVVHIVHNGEPVGTGGNISDDQVLSQIAVLNKDYNRLNTDADQTPSDFSGVAGSIAIEFVLARQAPDSSATNGIVRVKGSKATWSINDNTQLKAQSYWPSEDYLNIWVCRLSGYLGYAQFPISDLDGLEDYQHELAATDGVVFSYKDFGSSFEGYGTFAGLDTKYNRGRTATHEIGHFLGLRHIWGDVDNCGGTDYVDDTPAQRTETYDCPSHPLSPAGKWCNSKAPMFQNYMDYTDDACMNLFTQGQIDRMVTVLENSPRRKSLLTSHGLMAPDPFPNDVAITSILNLPVISCDASPTPTLRVTNVGTLPLTSFNLSYALNGGTPIVQSLTGLNMANAEHKDIALTGITLSKLRNELYVALTQPNGVDDEGPYDNNRSQITYWDDTRGSIPMPVTFENQDSLLWTSVNPGGQRVWQRVRTNSGKPNVTNDNHAVYFNGFDDPILSDQAWYVSPVLDFSQTARSTLFFDWSYRRRSTGSVDNVVVMASSDCGTTFTPLYTLPLNSSAEGKTEWKPDAASAWSTNQAINLDAYAGQEQVRLAFVFTNGNGNNFYLDNLNFFVPQPFTLYPNPARDNFYIAFNFQEETSASIEVIDAMGKLVRQESLGDARNQNHAVPVDALRPGVYVVRVRTSNQVWSTRFVRGGQ